jgi:hypothetical protein
LQNLNLFRTVGAEKIGIIDLRIQHSGGDRLVSGQWKLSIVPVGNAPVYRDFPPDLQSYLCKCCYIFIYYYGIYILVQILHVRRLNMTSKITKIGLIIILMGIGTLAAYYVNSFNPVGPKGIILFDLSISVFLTMSFEKISKNPDFTNF